ncbi:MULTISPECIES: RadC family protein [Fusobacterium]|uniref:RadC family protein n=1 Tax=Fusobacterium TaxID=848 RepID=UPI0025BED7B0|nr:DNA repair protein RadC [Fusobacterium sp.]MCI5724667.1 DNA repair protein RadC [Fusobacterium sp.]MCI7223603.1 DNA repair protein RadC [Fusobacterium sp.]MDD7411387.1 DNA repair protein RadC [Fusobacteriaceae bacterium]MDY5713741.1 DNA repair protein RadC [Fusobacterium gastrosuis]
MEEHFGHRKRIREKYLKSSIELFQDYEILELLLTYAIPRKDTKIEAKNLIKKFGTIENVLKAKEEELLKIEGIGKSTISFLKLMGELPSIFYKNKIRESENILIKSKDNLIRFLREKIAFEKIEKFFVLYLSSSNELLAYEEKSSGTIDRSSIYPREIYKDVIKYNAKAIIIAHNHPSENLKPSRSDLDITKELAEGLKNFDALLLEHIIITKTSYFSFLEEGLI